MLVFTAQSVGNILNAWQYIDNILPVQSFVATWMNACFVSSVLCTGNLPSAAWWWCLRPPRPCACPWEYRSPALRWTPRKAWTRPFSAPSAPDEKEQESSSSRRTLSIPSCELSLAHTQRFLKSKVIKKMWETTRLRASRDRFYTLDVWWATGRSPDAPTDSVTQQAESRLWNSKSSKINPTLG